MTKIAFLFIFSLVTCIEVVAFPKDSEPLTCPKIVRAARVQFSYEKLLPITAIGEAKRDELAADAKEGMFTLAQTKEIVRELRKRPEVLAALAETLQKLKADIIEAVVDTIDNPGSHGRPWSQDVLFARAVLNRFGKTLGLPVLAMPAWKGYEGLRDKGKITEIEGRILRLRIFDLNCSVLSQFLEYLRSAPDSQVARLIDFHRQLHPNLQFARAEEKKKGMFDGVGHLLDGDVMKWFTHSSESRLHQVREKLAQFEARSRTLLFFLDWVAEIDLLVTIALKNQTR